MEKILESLGLENVTILFNATRDFLFSCIRLIGKCFSWMGPEFIVILTVGVVVAIILRFAGR